MNKTIQMTTKKTPLELFHEGQTNESIVDRLWASAAKRYYSRVYKERKLKAGDKIILSMKVSANAPFWVKDAIAEGKTLAEGKHKSYKQQWDTSHGPYTIERSWGDHEYRLAELQGNYDRTDLLKVVDERSPGLLGGVMGGRPEGPARHQS